MKSPIPAEALADHIAILGKTGSGKSNAAKTLVEDALDAGERVCIIDPTGTWYGLRLTAKGKPSPYKVVIFGGKHADIPIGGAHGAAIAETVGTSSTPAVIDTRLMTVADRTRFFTDFAEALLRTVQGRLTLVIDEAHVFAPQGKVSDPRSGAMLHAANNLVSLGRGLGLRIIMISQRPAKLHKDSLTQVETLVAMRLIAPQDRAAVGDWIKECADPGQGREIMTSLASMQTGDAWVWSPQINVLHRGHFRLAKTFDSGRAPSGEVGPSLGALDLAEVKGRLEQVAAEVVANDPRTLRAEIAALKKELAAKPTPAQTYDVETVEAAERAGFAAGLVEGEKRGNVAGQALALTRVRNALDALKVVEAAETSDAPLPPPPPQRVRTQLLSAAPAAPKPAPAPRPPVEANGSLSAPQRKVLEALAFWDGLGIHQPTRVQVGNAAGYSPSSGGFANLLGTLRTAGHIDYPAGGCVALTEGGRAQAPTPDGRTPIERVNSILSGPQERVLAAILRGPGSREEIAEATGYSATSGGFANLLGSLRSLGLIDYPGKGQVEAADWLVTSC